MGFYPQIVSGVYNPPVAHYSHVKLSGDDVDDIRKIRGRNGEHFKWITSLSKAKYIWDREVVFHDGVQGHVIEIWGPMDCHVLAKNMLHDHLERLDKKRKSQKHLDDTMQ